MYSKMETALERILQEAVENKKVAGVSVMLIRDKEVVLSLQTGQADRERDLPMRENTIFRLHSMTKPVVAAAAMHLIEQGKLGLEDPVSRYLPACDHLKVAAEEGAAVRAQRPMRLYHLLNMTSGLVYPDGDTDAGIRMGEAFSAIMEGMEKTQDACGRGGLTTQEAAQRFLQCPLAFEPGMGWAYGVSADVLGAVLEKAADRRLGELLQHEILDPLGMCDTAFGVPDSKRDRLCAVYEECPGAGEPLPLYEAGELGLAYDAPDNPEFESGGAGLCGTLTDYRKFANMLLQGGQHLLRPETVRYMTGTGINGVQQRAFNRVTMFSLGRYTYGSLMRKCLRSDISPRLARRGEYGWGGQDGTDFVNFPEEKAVLLIGMQKRNARMYSLGKKIRGAVLQYL